MVDGAPYWGDLPDLRKASNPTSSNAGAGSSPTAAGRQQLEAATQLRPKPNRVSIQTTNTDAPTESTMSPYASPASSQFPDQGLAPRPPSFPYSAATANATRAQQSHQRQISQDSVDLSSRHHHHRNQSDDAGYSNTRDSHENPINYLQEDFDEGDDDPLPAAPEVPRGPPLSYRPPFSDANYVYSPGPANHPQASRSVRRPDLPASGGSSPMDVDNPEHFYMTGAGPVTQDATASRAADGRSRIPTDRNASSNKTHPRSVGGGGAKPQLVTQQRPPDLEPENATLAYAADASAPRRQVSSSGNHTDRQKKFDDIRSPLQKLELTLDSITKEEKRARMEAAEQAARDRERRPTAERNLPQQHQQQQPAQQQQRRQYTQQQQQKQAPTSHTATRSQSVRYQQPDQQQQPQQQQVRFREQIPSEVDNEPRPLLQPDMSPVEESYPPNVADRMPISQYPAKPPPPPPDSEKPRYRQDQSSRAPARVPDSGIPQRNLSFRERAARNDVRLPHGDGLLPAAPNEAGHSSGSGAVPQRRSSTRSGKLHKEPPGDPWYSQRNDIENMYPVVHPRGGPPPQTTTVSPGAVSGMQFADADINVQDTIPQGRNLQDIHAPAKVPTQQNPAQQDASIQTTGKLVKSPSQRRPQPGVYANADPNRAMPQTANVRDFDGAYDNHGNNRSHLLNAAVISGAAGAVGATAASAAGGAPPRRTARFEEEHIDTNDQMAREARHFDNPHHHRISNMVYRNRNNLQPGQGTYNPPDYLEEWKQGLVGTLSGPLLELNDRTSPSSGRDKAWWEQNGRRRGSTSGRPRKAEAFDGEYDEANGPSRFKPPLHLVCGPLLRYCGIRKERSVSRGSRNGRGNATSEKEFWRGSVMIVTRNTDSSYEIAPMLRMFVQPLDLLPPPPTEVQGTLPPEYVDPLVGHPKLGRNGETLYVRPVEHLQEAKDLSRDETDGGLFEKTRSSTGGAAGDLNDSPGSFAARLKKTEIDGEKAGKFKDVRGFRLHVERGVTFWRFNIEIELRDHQQRIAYRINRGPSTGFWVPAKDQPMHIMFYSCNGFSLSVDPDQFSGPDPLWRDVLNNHQTQPFHVMIGGGDQLYNDAVMNQTKIFQDWLGTRNPITKGNAPFMPEMQDELETFYLNRYAMWFSQGLFSLANSQIPMVNMYDDHDIIDGFGSYPHHFMNSPVFSGLGNVAFKYYMLFQHQSVVGETEKSEPSWILGQTPGPYIHEVSRSLFMHLGAKVALLAVDCRTERTRGEVLQEDTWKRIIDRCYAEIEKGKTEHLLVQLGIPIAYPRLVWLENILTSRLMEPVKLLGKAGLLGNFLNHFDGGVEILDDLDDHWTAKSHKDERKVVIEDLQDLAADRSVRVTILSGDVHLAAIGQFYSNRKQELAKHEDFRYMPNVISSAIANTPPPDLLADILNKRNKIHHFDKETDEDMIPIFGHGVDGKPRNNKTLLPHRNWCSIQAYTPGSTPTPTPSQSEANVASSETANGSRRNFFSRNSSFHSNPHNGNDPSRPPLSGGLLRRLSRGRRSADNIQRPNMYDVGPKRSFSMSRDLRPTSLFRRLSSRRQRPSDDGGINGNWGPDSEEDLPPQEQYPQAGAPPIPPKVPIGYGNGQVSSQGYNQAPGTRGRGNGARAVAYPDGDQSTLSSEEDVRGGMAGNRGQQARIRGGAGSSSALAGGDTYGQSEFENGDESYFSVKRRPVGPARSQTAPDGFAVSGAESGATLPASEGGAALPPTRPFYRTPTGLTTKQMKRAQNYAVNLEGGLDIRLNVEVNPKDPSGITVPYRLVVPRLWHTYQANPAAGAEADGGYKAAPTGLKRLLSIGQRKPAQQPIQHMQTAPQYMESVQPGQGQHGQMAQPGLQGPPGPQGTTGVYQPVN